MKHIAPQNLEFDFFSDEINQEAPSISTTATDGEGEGEDELSAPEAYANLAEVQDRYRGAFSSHKNRDAFISAINTLSRVIGQKPDQLPAGGPELRKLINEAIPATAGIAQKRWRCAVSLTRCALRDAGAGVAMARDDAKLAEPWNALFERIEDRRVKAGVSRLVRFASSQGVAPDGFKLEVFKAFGAGLEAGSIEGDPAAILRLAARSFNAAAAADPEWPQTPLPVSANPNRYSLAWNAFLPKFVADVDAMLADSQVDDVWTEDKRKAVRPSTLQNRRYMIRIFASAMIQSGKVTVRDLNSLADLVKMENVQTGLAYLTQRAGEAKPYHLAFLHLAGTIARHHVQDEPLARRLRNLLATSKQRVEGGSAKGMKPKNRKRLRQFDSPDGLDALLFLPDRVLRRVGKRTPVRCDAIAVMHALQVAILTCAPVRLKNLTELEIGKSFVDFGKGGHRRVRIELAGRDTKTSVDYSAPISKRLHPLIDAWTTIYRPLICRTPSDYLFPSPSGAKRNKGAVSVSIKAFIDRETGLKMNPHLFRHLAAKLILENDSGDIESARQVLCHKSRETTLNAYAEFQVDPAFHRLDDAQADRGAKALRKARGPARPSRSPPPKRPKS